MVGSIQCALGQPANEASSAVRELQTVVTCMPQEELGVCLAGPGMTFELVDVRLSEWQDTTWGVFLNLGFPMQAPLSDSGQHVWGGGLKIYFHTLSSLPAGKLTWTRQWVAGLLQTPPNPCFPIPLLRLYLPPTGKASLMIHDWTGRLVRNLWERPDGMAIREVVWDGRNEEGARVNTGIYFYCLASGDFRQIGKMILIQRS